MLIGCKYMVYTILLILGFFAFFGEIGLIIFWLSGYIRFKDQKINKYFPKVSIIVPCKGIRENFNENILSICNQNYKNFNVLFVIDSKKDPAYQRLRKLVGNKTNVNLVISIE